MRLISLRVCMLLREKAKEDTVSQPQHSHLEFKTVFRSRGSSKDVKPSSEAEPLGVSNNTLLAPKSAK